MSLEQLSKDWDSIDESINEIEIPNEEINRILKLKYRSFVNRLLIFEIIIPAVYLYFIILIIFRFDILGKLYLEVLGGISILILISLFVLRFLKLVDTFRNRFLDDSHIMTIKKLAKRNLQVQKYYLINIVLGFLLTVLILILSIKIYNEYDLIQNQYFWFVIIPSSLIFIVLINNWIKKHYNNVVRESEELLKMLK